MKIIAAIATHFHFDHVGALSQRTHPPTDSQTRTHAHYVPPLGRAAHVWLHRAQAPMKTCGRALLQRATRCCSVPHDVATCRTMLQRAARCCSVPQDVATALLRGAASCACHRRRAADGPHFTHPRAARPIQASRPSSRIVRIVLRESFFSPCGSDVRRYVPADERETISEQCKPTHAHARTHPHTLARAHTHTHSHTRTHTDAHTHTHARARTGAVLRWRNLCRF
jgi:hypothetical protein